MSDDKHPTTQDKGTKKADLEEALKQQEKSMERFRKRVDKSN